MVTEKKAISLDDLIALGDDVRVEVIDWEMVPMAAAGLLHQFVASNVIRILDAYIYPRGIGSILPDGTTFLMNSPTAGLKDSFVPDVSFIIHENIPSNFEIEKPHPGAPDLAVEIISPGDEADKVQQKIRTYLNQGTQQVWLVYPSTKEIHQYISGEPETVNIYKGSATVDAEALFPGIEGLTTDAIFKLPKWMMMDKE